MCEGGRSPEKTGANDLHRLSKHRLHRDILPPQTQSTKRRQRASSHGSVGGASVHDIQNLQHRFLQQSQPVIIWVCNGGLLGDGEDEGGFHCVGVFDRLLGAPSPPPPEFPCFFGLGGELVEGPAD